MQLFKFSWRFNVFSVIRDSKTWNIYSTIKDFIYFLHYDIQYRICNWKILYYKDVSSFKKQSLCHLDLDKWLLFQIFFICTSWKSWLAGRDFKISFSKYLWRCRIFSIDIFTCLVHSYIFGSLEIFFLVLKMFIPY